jgi:hypothetical protein
MSTTTGPGLPVVANQPVVLRAGACNPDSVALLKRIIADEMRRHLSGDHDQRNGIHQRIGQSGNGIGCPRPRSDQHDARFSGGTRITFGGVHSTLLVTNENMDQLVVLEKRVVDRKYRAAGVTKDMFHVVVFEGTDNNFRAAQFQHVCGWYCGLLVHDALPQRVEIRNSRPDSKRKGRFRPL